MEAGGPGGRGASCLNPQTSDYFTYSCFDLWICSCWPHKHHVSILNPLLFPPSLHFLTPPLYLVLVFLLLFISQQFPPSLSWDPPAFPLLPLTAPCAFHFILIFPFAVPQIPIEAFWAKLPPLDLRVCFTMQLLVEFYLILCPKMLHFPPKGCSSFLKKMSPKTGSLHFLWGNLQVVFVRGADHPTAPLSKGKSHDVSYVNTASFHPYVYVFIHIIRTHRSSLANGNESYSAVN